MGSGGSIDHPVDVEEARRRAGAHWTESVFLEAATADGKISAAKWNELVEWYKSEEVSTEYATVLDEGQDHDDATIDDDVPIASMGYAAGYAPEESSKAAERKRTKGVFTVNTSACTGKTSKFLFSAVAAELGWREVDVDATRGATAGGERKKSRFPTIYCIMQTNDLLERLPLPNHCWATRYLGLPDMCDKGNLARMFQTARDFAAEEAFDFNPPTWILPDQLESLRTTIGNSSKTYIVKPEDGSQGDGIFLVQGVRDLDVKLSVKANAAGVAQRYLQKPLLSRGFKFDFRVYVALVGGSSVAPPRVFLCKEGLARYCTEPYVEPSQKNMHKSMGHLTNYSLNKRSEQFEHSGETLEAVFSPTSEASKRPLSLALKQIEEEHPDFNVQAFYDSLEIMVQTTVAVMSPVLVHAAGRKDETDDSELRCCQVLGFDVMLDRRFKPYLLEVNNSPSLCIDEAIAVDPSEICRATDVGESRLPNRDGICRCMDMQKPHRHQTSLVDLVVKKTVVGGLFQLLAQLRNGIEELESEAYITVDMQGDQLFELLRQVGALFTRAGGAPKAFTSASLRRTLGSLCGNGSSLEKHDLDVYAQRFRASQFKTRDRAAGGSAFDALRLFDYLELLKQTSAKAFPGVLPLDAVGRALQLAGA